MTDLASVDSAIPPYRGEHNYIPDKDNAIFNAQMRADVLDFSGRTLLANTNVLRGANVDPVRVSGWISFSGNYDTGFVYSDFRQLTTDNDAKILGYGSFPTLLSGAAADRAQAFSGVLQVNSGAQMSDRNSDAVAGFHTLWAKLVGVDGFTFEAGARAAPIWSDLQLYGVTVAAEETANFLVTNGGAQARSVFDLETTVNLGWVSLFRFDQAIGTPPVVANTVYDTPETNTPDAFITVTVNGTPYGIPLMAAS